MDRKEMISYINEIKPFLNLSALCSYYNSRHSENTIDYNNLRVAINYENTQRLSTDKLMAFINFLHKDIYEDVFKISSCKISALEKEEIKRIVNKHMLLLEEEIKEF